MKTVYKFIIICFLIIGVSLKGFTKSSIQICLENILNPMIDNLNSGNKILSHKITIPISANTIKKIGAFTQKKINPDSIKLSVWNVFKGKKENWGSEFKKISQKSDLILIQEASLNSSMQKTFSESNKFEYSFAESFRPINGQTPTGVATASKTGSVKNYAVKSDATEPLLGTPKLAIISQYPVKGSSENLMVVNIHAINFVSAKKFINHIKKTLEFVKNHNGPVVFAGDFNTWTFRKEIKLGKLMRESGLKEVMFSNDKRHKVMGHALDRVFINNKLDYRSSEVLHGYTGSDHKPIQIELFVK